MSVNYRYDGTFAGLLSTVALILNGGEPPSAFDAGPSAQADLFSAVVDVATDAAAAAGLRTALRERSGNAERIAVWAFLAATPDKELAIYRFLAELLAPGFPLGLGQPLPAAELAAEVRSEAYRFKGLVRFRELADGLLYAPISPRHRVLSLLAPHFAARLGEARWLIHDIGRNAALAGCGGRWREGPLAIAATELSDREQECQRLWRRFFKEVAIAERVSAERQRRGLPLKVRRHLVELP